MYGDLVSVIMPTYNSSKFFAACFKYCAISETTFRTYDIIGSEIG